MTKQALIELRDSVAAGKEHYLVGKIAEVFGPFDEPERGKSWLAYNAWQGSLDAAVAFLEAVLPGWVYVVANTSPYKDDHSICAVFPRSEDPEKSFEAEADTPARALLLATLDALIERAE